ncbi:MAG TPA: endolytic transglycosylase MltG [Candidatus Saccharimonadales bacterium]|nr:endolytic transglycosylase MltG [Candidatus Saccharimonadales bacterium]
MKYRVDGVRRRSWLGRVIICLGVLAILLTAATVAVWRFYSTNLQPVGGNGVPQTVLIAAGSSPASIADLLHTRGLIRSAWTFEAYVRHEGVGEDLQAGTYVLSPQLSVSAIVSQLTHGEVKTQLLTILPGQRLDQIEQSLINDGFSKADVENALRPSQYENSPALVDKPAGNSLEGYLYPDSFQRTDTTDAGTIIQESIAEMQSHLTPDIRAAFAKEGLSTYQGIIVASIVDQEVSKPADRAQAAQVFLKRLNMGMPLGSDVTAMYGSRLAGQGTSLAYDTPYNTRLHTGLPPTPISNVDDSALQAVAHPANTDWLYFVAGDDGTTHFSTTYQQQQADAAQYCHKLCQ